MNVLVRAACARHRTEPLRPLPELPPRPEHDGRRNPDGSRHAPPTVPPGTYAVDPEQCGAPFVPHPDPEWAGAAVPGVCVADPDGPGFLMPAGPRDTLVVGPEDTAGFLSYKPACQDHGCRGATGQEGPNQVCGGGGAVVATLFGECYGPYETHVLPDAVRTVPA